MRLIDADTLEKSICQDKCGLEECYMTLERDGAECCLEVQGIKDAPTIDAVEVVRCKDCKHCQYDIIFGGIWCNGKKVSGDWFCADGERRTK